MIMQYQFERLTRNWKIIRPNIDEITKYQLYFEKQLSVVLTDKKENRRTLLIPRLFSCKMTGARSDL